MAHPCLIFADKTERYDTVSQVKVSKATLVGSGGHIRCFLSSASGGNIKAMAFRMADTEAGMALLKSHGTPLSVIGTLRPDNWMGRRGVQFIIEDVKSSSSGLLEQF